MDIWLEWARGPLFRFALAVLILGLARILFLFGAGIANSIYHAKDRKGHVSSILLTILKWLFPFKGMKSQPAYTVTVILFHLGLIVTPLFLAAHIMLWRRSIGVGWPSLEYGVADAFTVITIVAGILLTIGRIARPGTSTFQDYVLPPLLVVPFLFGFLAMHPGLHPLPYEAVMLIHVMSANLVMALVPFTKMGHVVLLPTAIVSELGWSIITDRGEKDGLSFPEKELS